MQNCCGKGHEFTPENTYYPPNGASRHCRTCRRDRSKANPIKYDPIKMREWRKNWRDRNPNYHRDHALVKKYGISPEYYEKMFSEQSGKCAICFEPMDKPHVDHNHATGHVRQLLCQLCNHGIGSLKENEATLLSAVEYLRKHSGASECHH